MHVHMSIHAHDNSTVLNTYIIVGFLTSAFPCLNGFDGSHEWHYFVLHLWLLRRGFTERCPSFCIQTTIFFWRQSTRHFNVTPRTMFFPEMRYFKNKAYYCNVSIAKSYFAYFVSLTVDNIFNRRWYEICLFVSVNQSIRA